MRIDKQQKIIFVPVPGCPALGADSLPDVPLAELTDIQRRTYTYHVPLRNEAERLHHLALAFLKTPVGRRFVSTRLLRSLDDLYDFLYENPSYLYEHFPSFESTIQQLPADRVHVVPVEGDPDFQPSIALSRLLNFRSAPTTPPTRFGISTYYINMDKATDRRKVLEKGARKQQIPLIRISAITPKTLGDVIDLPFAHLPKNEQIHFSCTTSHLVALHTFLEQSNHEFALILEDDICLDGMKKWPFVLEDLARNMPEDCGILQLSAIWPVRPQGDRLVILAPSEFKLRQHVANADWNTAAYLIRRQHAEKLIRFYRQDGKFHLSRYPGPKAADVLLYDDTVYRSGYRTLMVPLLYCQGLEQQSSSFDRDSGQTLMHNVSRNYTMQRLEQNFSLSSLGFFDATPVTPFPRVSIITPTYNRAKFLPLLEERILQQTYPRCQMEWIIVDDSTDGSPDFVPRPGTGLTVVYERLSEKMVLGAKRNYTARKATGNILVHMDDDDYYPPTRVALAVDALNRNPEVLMAGSTTLPIFYLEQEELWLAGPYHQNHSTAGAWAYRRILLETQTHDPTKTYGEETSFLENFTIPMQQMNHYQTMVCFAHRENTFDKNVMREKVTSTVKKASEDIRQIVPPDILAQYLAIHREQKAKAST